MAKLSSTELRSIQRVIRAHGTGNILDALRDYWFRNVGLAEGSDEVYELLSRTRAQYDEIRTRIENEAFSDPENH